MELNIIRYCAEECMRQRSGEVSVYNMCNAWHFAQEKWDYCTDCATNKEVHNIAFAHITLEFIEHLGKLVEPVQNLNGFRKIPIYVGNGWEMIEKAPWNRVPELLTALLSSYYQGLLYSTTDNGWGITHSSANKLSQSAEDQFYYEYENIHPFRDGNGRTGKILYNYLKGTLDDPVMPPNYWGSSNP